ncbi:MAG TPA: hypothetical protein VMW95_07975, partial [Desulfobacterales bacterium]|nr:hypothetical protein [Desulfobacterales bacterium]
MNKRYAGMFGIRYKLPDRSCGFRKRVADSYCMSMYFCMNSKLMELAQDIFVFQMIIQKDISTRS